jgi:hypothetical protein
MAQRRETLPQFGEDDSSVEEPRGKKKMCPSRFFFQITEDFSPSVATILQGTRWPDRQVFQVLSRTPSRTRYLGRPNPVGKRGSIASANMVGLFDRFVLSGIPFSDGLSVSLALFRYLGERWAYGGCTRFRPVSCDAYALSTMGYHRGVLSQCTRALSCPSAYQNLEIASRFKRTVSIVNLVFIIYNSEGGHAKGWHRHTLEGRGGKGSKNATVQSLCCVFARQAGLEVSPLHHEQRHRTWAIPRPMLSCSTSHAWLRVTPLQRTKEVQ